MKPETESLAAWSEKPIGVDKIVAAAIRFVKLKQERQRRMQQTTFTRAYAAKWLEPLQPRIVKAERDLISAVDSLSRRAPGPTENRPRPTISLVRTLENG